MRPSVIGTVLCLGAALACQPRDKATKPNADSTLLAEREANFERRRAASDSGSADDPIALWKLAGGLKEISGLTLTSKGRLFTHNDSRGHVFEIDYRRGTIVKEFSLGTKVVQGDFEAITMIGDSILMLTSDGILYQFPEGADGKAVPYTQFDTGLGDRCEFEGLAYDPAIKSLLLACKKVHDKSLKDSLIIFRLPRDSAQADNKDKEKHKKAAKGNPSYLAVPISRIVGSNDWNGWHPSDITIDPFNGNYVLISSLEHSIIEITPAGEVVFARSLPKNHEQPEGVAITRDSILIISDEAHGGSATITLYHWRK